MTQPLVSVRIIIFNMIEFIHETLTSALEQDYDNLEVIAADDGSTDGTIDVIQDYARKYPGRLVALTGGPHLGYAGNTNRALQACKGKYIAFQDGDDVLLPGKIRKQVEWMEADERRILCGHDVEAFQSHTGKRLYLFSERTALRHGTGADWIVRNGVPFCNTSAMMRASSLPSYGVDPKVALLTDWILYIEALARGGTWGYVDGVYARYRRHQGNVTKTLVNERQDDLFAILALVESRYPSLLRACRYARSRIYRTAGMVHMRQGDPQTARKYWIASVREWPHWKGILASGLTFLPAAPRSILLNRFSPPFLD